MAEADSADSALGDAENEGSNVNSNAQSNGNDDIKLREGNSQSKNKNKNKNTNKNTNTNKNKNKNITARKNTSKSTDSKRKSESSTNPKRKKNRNSGLIKSSEIVYVSESSGEEEAEKLEVEVQIERVPASVTEAEREPEVDVQAESEAESDSEFEIIQAHIEPEVQVVEHDTELETINDPQVEPEAEARAEEEANNSESDTSSAFNEEAWNREHFDGDYDNPAFNFLRPNTFVSKHDGFFGFVDISDKQMELNEEENYDTAEIEVIQMQVSNTSGRPNPQRRKRKRNNAATDESDADSVTPSISLTSQISIVTCIKRSKNGSPGSKVSRRSNVDLTNPKFLIPFEFGWKREVVTRGITSREDGICKDVYYFHPSGKKLRSLREVSERCTEKITAGVAPEHFTFYKEPLGVDPTFEIVRNARSLPSYSRSSSDRSTPRGTPVRRGRGRKSPASSSRASSSPRSRRGTSGRRTSQRTTRRTASAAPPPPKRQRTTPRCNRGTPRIALRRPAAAAAAAAANGGGRLPTAATRVEGPKPHPDAPAGPRRKITPRRRFPKPVTTIEELEMLPGPRRRGSRTPSNESLSWSHLDEKSTNQEGEQDYCTIRCTNAMGLIPTLQCSICLYIYHPDCCDMDHITSVYAAITYICENCQAKSSETKERGLVKNITPAVVTCDKSPPIISPKPIHPLVMSQVTPSAPLASAIPQIRPRPPSSSSAGAVTTWHPPANRVFRPPSIPTPIHHRPERSLTPPQSIVNLNHKRYIVVPKHSVFSFAANQNSSPARAEYNPSATIITPTPTSTIIEGPPLQSNPFIQTTDTGSGMLMFPFRTGENPNAGSISQFLFANPIAGSSATQRFSQPDLPIGSDTLDHFAKIKDKVSKRSTAQGVDESMQNFMRNICIGYTALLHVFQYLKVQELLRAGRVCRLWRDIAGHSSLWRTVRMKNSQVSDWKGFTDAMVRHGTKFLDLRKMLVSLDETEEMWTVFAKHISSVKTLEGMEMCRCSVNVLEQVIRACPQLVIFNAQMIGMKEQMSNQFLKIETLTQMKQLRELRLKSIYGLNLVGSLTSFIPLASTIRVLSLTSIRNLGELDVYQIAKLHNLESLELGECTELPEDFPTAVLAKLPIVKRLRFEKGPARCTATEMLYVMKGMTHLVQLELINFDIRPGFDEALANCTNIKRLLLIPTYVTQSATTNHIVLNGAYKLWANLTHFVWVVTMELLKVTELFVDQCDGNGTKGGTSVPVLKPVPVSEINVPETSYYTKKPEEEEETDSKCTTPITVIPIDKLDEMVKAGLPKTRVKLLKIPFQNTWRQSFVEGSV